uniref:glycine cleavage system aminomethyltransferase GcvT n=1 Tax=Proteiniclasticum sp. TaxID=2053595 RepID=UPI00289B7BDC
KEDILLVVNASNTEKDYQWVLGNHKDEHVEIENISNETAQLAIQGPKAESLLQAHTDEDLSEIKFFFAKRNVEIDGIDCMVSRTGYTGEDGFEIYLSNDKVVELYTNLIEDGAAPIGLGARDTLRFEANLPLYGNELSDDWTPIEAGYGFFVKTDKADFIGKEVLKKQKEDGVSRKIVGFTMLDKKIPRHGYRVLKDGEEIGFVTTGYKSPTLGEIIGLAMVKTEFSKMGTEIDVEIRNKTSQATVRSRKFLQK